MKIHKVKIWPEYFRAVQDGSKTFEVRNDDRGYIKGDTIVLREWNPANSKYTGYSLTFTIGYVYAVDDFVVCFSLLPAHLVRSSRKRKEGR